MINEITEKYKIKINEDIKNKKSINEDLILFRNEIIQYIYSVYSDNKNLNIKIDKEIKE